MELSIVRRPRWCGASGSRCDLWPLPRPLQQRPSSPGWRRGCQWLLIVWRWTCSTHVGSGLCGWCGGMSSTSLCAFWCWPGCVGIVWTSGGLLVVGQNFLQNGPPWETGWCCCGCVLAPLFWPSFRSTLPALAATPLQRTWLNESCWLSFTSWMSFMWLTRSFLLLHPSWS